MQLITRATLVITLVAGAAGSAHAYETGFQFDLDPTQSEPKGPGAGGIAFDGAPRWSNHDCSVCHTDPPHQIGVNLLADQPALFTDGWAPNKQYHLRVELTNEAAGLAYNANSETCGNTDSMQQPPYTPCNNNGFGLEIDDVLGRPVGTYAAVVGNACSTSTAGATINILKDGTAVHHAGTPGLSKWDFCWTSPGAGTGTVTAYVAVVDGNGGTGTIKFTANTIGDDVAVGSVPLFEAAVGPGAQNGGCDAGGGSTSGLVVVAIVVGFAIRRRRRALAAATLATALLGGCTHVRPHQREVLARDNMKFGPDPAEDELDLHMQESREGSSGGYGSSGGGCGCN